MDVEIVKQNGQKFRLSDYGVVQDFVVHSMDRTVVRDPIDGRSGSADYGIGVGDRSIEVPMIFKAADLHDYAHVRDEVYGLLDDSEPFYIREMRRPKSLQYDFVDFGQKPKWEPQTDNEYVNGKQYRVRLNSALTPEQRSLSGEVSIEFVTSGIPYAESVYTTLELHDSGYSATAEKYGLVDNIDDEKVKYRFTPEILTQNVGANPFKQGFLSSTTGLESESTTNIIIETYMNVVTGNNYQFIDEGTNGNVRFWWIYEYSESNTFIKSHSFGNKDFNFIPEGKKLKFMAQAYPDQTLSPSDVGVNILPRLKRPSTVNTFTVYNAGNVKVEPESMYLDISFQFTTIFDNLMTIKNITTGEVFEFKKSHSRRHLRINGMNVTMANVQAFRDTNKKFISLAPGENQFEVTGAVFDRADFDFKYIYK